MPNINMSINSLKYFERIKNNNFNSFNNIKNQIILPIVSSETAINQLITTLKEVSNDPQACLNQGHNKWIMKPHDASRGIGIQVKSNLDSIVNLLTDKNTKFIAQKYIERPLTYNYRKFDIRIWSCHTSVSPMISWVYQKF